MLKNISVKGNIVIFEVKEESKIVQMENEYIENEMIARGIWELFHTLADEKINMGIIDADKKENCYNKSVIMRVCNIYGKISCTDYEINTYSGLRPFWGA